ncbi:MAG TPA: aminotransferase class I/II-fold pyridoxal phosphate-dependent enzyme [Syntrophomonas sp.]|nr:aminotransferase class I/II-fold pyridoxal phosphate-dependent enzyme [Syntrophomonas sp.]HRW12417.1 aminotransferase class I/II-fold pyridoxal phosphate-dependent enzyme [Syntrophomonas sp.]
MIFFNNDYCEGAHPLVMEKLLATNLEQTIGYGEDHHCMEAARLIRKKCGRDDLDVHFLVGGTQTNFTFIASALRPHQGVISADTGHINVHETGSIEAVGHKILALPSPDGKITAAQVRQVCEDHYGDSTHEHMVQPKLVYISNPSEVGTIYSRAELTALHETCRQNDLILYMDGARLGYGLCSPENDLDLPAIARLCDAFYIGGTKVGLLFGEALVICDERLKPDFRYIIKQKGGMLAKGRLLGVQFAALFTDDLYFAMSRQAIALAMQIKAACTRKGYQFLIDSPTNQQFPILPDAMLERLSENFVYSYWQRVDDRHSAVRFCTSWATLPENVEQLIAAIEKS